MTMRGSFTVVQSNWDLEMGAEGRRIDWGKLVNTGELIYMSK